MLLHKIIAEILSKTLPLQIAQQDLGHTNTAWSLDGSKYPEKIIQ